MLKMTEQYLVDIVAHELGLSGTGTPGVDCQVWVRNQTITIPPDDKLYIMVGMVDSKVIANKTSQYTAQEHYPTPSDPLTTIMHEVFTAVTRENIQIDIMSRTNESLLRRWEVIAALTSVYAFQVMEKAQFKIFKVPTSFANTSNAEGSSMLNRFSIIVPCHTWYSKDKVLDSPNGNFYDSFRTRVDDEKTIGQINGLIDFTIT